MSALTLEHLGVSRDGVQVLHDVDLSVAPGECVGLIGPNGAGKTTLLRAALGLLPATGRASLGALDPMARARMAAWLPQERQIAWDMSVRDVVALGRLPHGGGVSGVEAALARLDLGALAGRIATRLSGGEQARVLIARALAQDTPLILADEPVAGLDPRAQIAVMRLLSDLAGEGRAVIAALHDLPLAARFCTRLVLIDRGRITADGPPGAVLGGPALAAAFGVRAWPIETPQGVLWQILEAAT